MQSHPRVFVAESSSKANEILARTCETITFNKVGKYISVLVTHPSESGIRSPIVFDSGGLSSAWPTPLVF